MKDERSRLFHGVLDRRTFIKSSTAAAITTFAGMEIGCAREPTLCTVTPTYQEGPFYINTLKLGLERSNLTEGIMGAPLRVRLKLIEAQTCKPCQNLLVDLWSANPRGRYSGVDNALLVEGAEDTRGETFMRGHQFTDRDGVVEFETLFPGWYELTPPHLHFTTQMSDERAYTWQFFIDDTFSDQVYTTVAPYSDRGVHPVRTSDGDRTVDSLTVTPTGSYSSPIIDMVVGIDTSQLLDRASEYEP